jgi:outer membrane immunogenic protein
MRTPFIIFTTISAIAFGSTPVSAQDRDPFVGARIEVNTGYESTHADDGIASTPNKLDGIRVGGAFGYDMAMGEKFTIGVEAGGGYTVSGDASGQVGTTTYRLKGGYDLDAALRVGFRASPTTLIYAKGGYARSQFKLRTSIGGTTGNTVTNVSDHEDGWRVGAGVEQSLGDRFYAKAEYRYTDYGHDVSRHQGLIGLGYRF